MTMAAADELAMIRAQITRLRRREQQVQGVLMRAGAEGRIGLWARAEVVERSMRIFDHRRLPVWVRDDPAYWNTRQISEIALSDVTGAGPPLVHLAGIGSGAEARM